MLNKGLDSRPWVMAPDSFAITTAKITGKDKLEFNAANGIIVKSFINKETGEIRNFIAKIIEGTDENKLLS
jgi:hypothetical protein